MFIRDQSRMFTKIGSMVLVDGSRLSFSDVLGVARRDEVVGITADAVAAMERSRAWWNGWPRATRRSTP